MGKKNKPKLFFRDGFWTQARLEQLEKLSKNKTAHELTSQFDQTPEAIQAAIDFMLKHRKLLVSITPLKHGTHTVYAPARAEGVFDGYVGY